jgi:hypothetical protein
MLEKVKLIADNPLKAATEDFNKVDIIEVIDPDD